MFGVENVAAGLGGGFLQGSADVKLMQQKFEQQSELNQMQLYASLLKSGRWAPVDPAKGVEEGGVIKVGSIGMLSPVPDQTDEQALYFKMAQLELAKKADERAEIQARRQEEMFPLEVQGKLLGLEKTRKDIDRPDASSPLIVTDQQGNIRSLDRAKGEMPQPGEIPVATDLTDIRGREGLGLRHKEQELGALRALYSETQGTIRALRQGLDNDGLLYSSIKSKGGDKLAPLVEGYEKKQRELEQALEMQGRIREEIRRKGGVVPFQDEDLLRSDDVVYEDQQIESGSDVGVLRQMLNFITGEEAPKQTKQVVRGRIKQ